MVVVAATLVIVPDDTYDTTPAPPALYALKPGPGPIPCPAKSRDGKSRAISNRIIAESSNLR